MDICRPASDNLFQLADRYVIPDLLKQLLASNFLKADILINNARTQFQCTRLVWWQDRCVDASIIVGSQQALGLPRLTCIYRCQTQPVLMQLITVIQNPFLQKLLSVCFVFLNSFHKCMQKYDFTGSLVNIKCLHTTTANSQRVLYACITISETQLSFH